MDVRAAARGRFLTLPWEQPGWLDDAARWIDAHVERTGPVEVVLAREWSAVARVHTTAGETWFKEDPPAFAFEPALTVLLADRRPDALPQVIAAEGPRLLTRDAGRRLRTQLDRALPAPEWEELLARQAELELDLVDTVEDALELGTPDARPAQLERFSEELPGAARRRDAVDRAIAAIEGVVPTTVVHTEAHDGNLFVLDGRVRLLDWAEAVVSHPFVGTVLPLRFAVERTGTSAEQLRDAYLEPFTRFATIAELRDAFTHGYLLGTLARALSWHRLGPVERDDPVAAWLEIFDGAADGTITLGEA